ncbi:MAG TPA: ATP-binding protein, partial [Anaerolineae bacterium]|nr:ATP-binding protein [Anaerolineae bacterium]
EANASLDDVRRDLLGPNGDTHPPGLITQSNLSARVINAQGQIIAANGLLTSAPLDAALLTQAAQRGGLLQTMIVTDSIQARVYILPLERDGQAMGYIEVAEALSVTEATLRSLTLILFGAVPITLALAAFGSWFIADRALHPIDAITRQAQAIGEQDLHRRLNLDLPDDEVGRLARTFDAMLDRLHAAFQRERQFTADASHELRTPLTVIKTNIGVTLNRPRSAEQYQTALTEVEEEVDRLTRLTNDLLLLARADSGQPIASTREIDLVPIAQDVADGLRPLAEAKNLTLNFTSSERAKVHGNSDQLHRLCYNLIENAIKYTSRGSVSVKVAPSADRRVLLAVEDTGPGIAAEHLPHLFERFYRVDAARSREAGGSGLGLAIAHSIVTSHGGTIDVKSDFGHGTIVTVTLPAL